MAVFHDVIEGMKIIYRYNFHASITKLSNREEIHGAHNKQIWCGKYDTDYWMMSDPDLAQMNRLGWFVDGDSWSCYT